MIKNTSCLISSHLISRWFRDWTDLMRTYSPWTSTDYVYNQLILRMRTVNREMRFSLSVVYVRIAGRDMFSLYQLIKEIDRNYHSQVGRSQRNIPALPCIKDNKPWRGVSFTGIHKLKRNLWSGKDAGRMTRIPFSRSQADAKPDLTPTMLEDALGLPNTLLSGFSSRQNGLSTRNRRDWLPSRHRGKIQPQQCLSGGGRSGRSGRWCSGFWFWDWELGLHGSLGIWSILSLKTCSVRWQEWKA